jgi:hypothetical protein
MAMQGRTQRWLGTFVLAALVVPATLVVAAGPAGAVTVSTEEELRTAFGDVTETSIVLANDIVLDDCAAGDLNRTLVGPPIPLLTLDGAGFTITQTCDDRVLQTEGDLTLLNVTITGGNRLNSSGGGILLGDDGTASLIVRNSTITDNHATGGGSGGGIDGQTGGTILVEDSTISDNTAGDSGGGVRTFGAGVTITRSTVSGNSTEGDTGGGGGIDASQSSGPLVIVNSTITGNAAPGEFGGGVISDEVTLVYSTVTANTASGGANLAVNNGDGLLMPFASVIAEPLGGGTNCVFAIAGPSTTSSGYNFSDDASCALLDPTDREDAGDPELGALADNGGPTLTRLPASTSPLVDAIPDASCQDDGAADVSTDQRGVARPQIGGCDVGAVEIEAVVPPDPPVPTPVVITPTFTG